MPEDNRAFLELVRTVHQTIRANGMEPPALQDAQWRQARERWAALGVELPE